jgi:23S rRNA pseudouridine1911/1915/1917 synthase
MSYIVAKCREALIVYKPVGVLSESSQDKNNIVSLVGEELSALGEPTELYTVHRLDRAVSGLLVLARTKSAAQKLSRLVGEEGFGKEYLAVVEGEPNEKEGALIDYLKKDKLLSKAVIALASDATAKEARLSYKVINTAEGRKGRVSLLGITLDTGRFHQIRAQMSLRGMPLVGDAKYGSTDRFSRTPSLFCHRLEVKLENTTLVGSALPPIDAYPWSIFASELTEDLR